MKSEQVVDMILAYANEQLVPKRYGILTEIISDLIVKGLYNTLDEKLSIDGFDIGFIDSNNKI